MSQPKPSPFIALKGLQSTIFSLIGVHEVLFLAGIAALFEGIRGIWSLDGALIVCGGLLVMISLLGILISQRKVA